MNLKTDFHEYAWKIFLFRSLVGFSGAIIFVLNGGYFLYALGVYLFWEATINIVYFLLKRKNNLLARLWFLSTCMSPELFLIQCFFIFSYDNVVRTEIFVVLTLYIIGFVYIHFIYQDSNSDINISKKKSYMSGEGFGGYPSFECLDWFGKLYLYGPIIPIFISFLFIGSGRYGIDKTDGIIYHIKLMAMGYAFMFMMMLSFGVHLGFRRAVRVVRKYNLDWD